MASLCTPGRRMYCLLAYADPSDGDDPELSCDVFPVVAIRDCNEGLPDLMIAPDDCDVCLVSFHRCKDEFVTNLPGYVVSSRVIVMTGPEHKDGEEIKKCKESMYRSIKFKLEYNPDAHIRV